MSNAIFGVLQDWVQRGRKRKAERSRYDYESYFDYSI